MHKKLLIPGPTEVSQTILQEQTHPLIGHRSKEFQEFYVQVIAKLTEYFQLPSDCKPTVTTSSGTLWFDIVARSIVKHKALVCINGAFSERFGKTIQGCGKQADFMEVEWGRAVKPDMVAEKLETGEYDTLAVCHNESSTGVRNPIQEIGKMVRRNYPDVIYVIDAVSSMAGDKTFPAEIGCDIIFASTQKCFALPPGLAVGLVNDRALERARKIPNRGSYTDLVEIFEAEQKHQTPFTPCIPLLYALNKRMDLLLEETYEKVYERHRAMAEYTQQWANKHFAMFSEPGYESITVSCIQNTHGKSVKDLNMKLAEHGYVISNGYGKLAEKTFRIGHMGEWTLEEIKQVLAVIDEIWELA
ncbi:alanine--glyoxylate aminotransferase family protein [Candidatus Bathyarchaeota archaeon A05DMB-2]|jgi:aspartate aminotransferase-like enzyme|nr:alanine--glyoxylate aminotransferase family protein [Candidatus Bathyarchaeota archaeon A05DMB-2]